MLENNHIITGVVLIERDFRQAVASDVRVMQAWVGLRTSRKSAGRSMAHDANSSSNALASFRSSVSNPSVNQP